MKVTCVEGSWRVWSIAFDAQPFANVGIWPARYVPRGENPPRAGFEIFIDQNSAIDRQAGLRCKIKPRSHANADDDKLRFEHGAIIKTDPIGLDCRERAAQMKYDAVGLMERAHEIPERRAQHPLQDGQQRGVLVSGRCRIPCLARPAGEVVAGRQGVRVFGAQHPLADGQQRGELVPRPGRIPRQPGVVGEVAADGHGGRVFGAQHPLADG